MAVWKPSVTVAAVIEHQGRFLIVEESTVAGVRLNQPAGHLDPGETLVRAVLREALEETAHHVEVVAGIGVYLARFVHEQSQTDVTYLRFAFACQLANRPGGAFDPTRKLDHGILRTRLPGDITVSVRGQFVAIRASTPHFVAVAPLSPDAEEMVNRAFMAGTKIAILHSDEDLDLALAAWGLT